MIGRVASTEATVLIRGESGTGKELVARAIYQHSRRVAAPLVLLNCTAIPEALLESELFGHERGAFTGAMGRRIGKFEQADGGTIFLDEIGDVPLTTQAKLLRVLQQREFHRVGSSDTLRSDVRVIAATNRDLELAIQEGKFREDLYHRLNVVTISLPPLRERREDLPMLVKYFVRRFAQQLGIEEPLLPSATVDALIRYDWPGNVRELEHCIHRALIVSGGRPLHPDDLPFSKTRPPAVSGSFEEDILGEALNRLVRKYFDTYQGEAAHADLMDATERAAIEEALQRSGGNRSQAAKLLGIPRPTFHAKLNKLADRAAE